MYLERTFSFHTRTVLHISAEAPSLDEQIIQPLLEQYDDVISWQGVRAQESASRARLPEMELDDDNQPGLHVYLPLLQWTHDEVFALANALSRSWPRGKKIIADALGVKPEKIWPTRYFDKEGNRTEKTLRKEIK